MKIIYKEGKLCLIKIHVVKMYEKVLRQILFRRVYFFRDVIGERHWQNDSTKRNNNEPAILLTFI